MVASSKNSIEALAELAGEKRDEGEYARAFDVPAIRPGNETVYDRYPRDVPPEQPEAWARQQLVKIREICADNHGLAFRHYAKFLVGNRTILKVEVERAMEHFVASLPRSQLSGALQHAGRNFAVIYAGAVMAKRAGLIPWRLEPTRKALQTCFRDGVREIERSEGAEDRAKKVILGHLAAFPAVTSVTDVREVEGWYWHTKTGRMFAVPTPCFREWFPEREDERAALRWLYRNQLLKLKNGAKPDWRRRE